MAGSSDNALLEDIGYQIDEFSGDSQNADRVRTFTTAESTLLLEKQTDKELRKVEREVKNLERKIKIRKLDKEQKIKLLNDKEKMVVSSNIKSSDVGKDIERLTKEIALTKDITGIKILGTECQVTDIGETFLDRSYLVDGSCKGVRFRMEFSVKETWAKDDETTSAIEKLKLKLSDEENESTLRPIIEGLESEGSVTLLLHVLAAYGEWRKQREDVISQICDMYPDIAENGPVENQLVVRPKSIKGSELLFEWRVGFSDCYKAISRVSLTVKVPQEVDELDESTVLRSAPSMFNKMQDTLGTGRALEALLKTLCT